MPGLIYVMSPFGTDIVKVSDFPVVTVGEFPTTVGWTPDSRFILAGRQPGSSASEGPGIYLVPLDGSEPRRLTTARSSAVEFAPAVAPKGDRLAFVSCAGVLSCEIDVISFKASSDASGSATRVATSTGSLPGVAWSRDGQSLIYDDGGYLWRADANGHHPLERLDIAGNSAKGAAISLAGERLAFVRSDSGDTDIYRLNPDSSSTPVVTSSGADDSPAISPDGALVTFGSSRAGDHEEIWIAGIDGSSPRQVTRGPNDWQGSPSWSPDGLRLAFDSQGADKHWHIWAIDASGGTARQLTHGASDQNIPSWSSKGDYVYYNSTVDGQHHDVWRVKVDGSVEEQVTHIGSVAGGPYEVADGRYLALNDGTNNGLVLFPLTAGPVRKVADCMIDLGVRPHASAV